MGENKPLFQKQTLKFENKAENLFLKTEGTIWNTQHSSPMALWNSSWAPLWLLGVAREDTPQNGQQKRMWETISSLG